MTSLAKLQNAAVALQMAAANRRQYRRSSKLSKSQSLPLGGNLIMRQSLIATCLLLLAMSAIAQAQPAQQGTKEQPVAIIETSMGTLTCPLFPKAAPIGTANFIGLARGTKNWTDPKTGKAVHGVSLYDNTTFHRVIPEFMIQGGDPAGTGAGQIGIQFKNETSPNLRFDRAGRLAYANAGPDTNGSQFFITEVPKDYLDGNYTIFGQCDAASVELVKKIARMPRNAQDKPNTAIVIKHIRIDDGTMAKAPVKKIMTPAQ
jgi:peptidyl-prolyl cis-trans isomerase A (cyclophilin A)